MPWLAQGITWRGTGEPWDMGLFGAVPVGHANNRWRKLRTDLGFPGVVHARQVHGTRVHAHANVPPGLLIMEGDDAHATACPGILLTVSVADCIPVSLVDPERRVIALLHAGWRGVAGGMIESGIAALQAMGSAPAALKLHLGPAICGLCYEVGPEVHAQLGLPVPPAPEPVDIRAVAAARARHAGLPSAAITVSALCPRCAPERFFSHRAGSAGRQIGVLGIRTDPGHG